MAGQSSTAAARNKLVVRRLPPTLPEDIFWKSVAQWINEKTCSWKRYVKGKAADGTFDSHPTYSRAYVLMSSPEALVEFHKAFDGHIFKSKTGLEYQAVVEYAPVQKTPFKAKVKADARQGTIDQDPDYQSFLESLNAAPTKPALEASAPVPQPTSTPLLDHLRAQGKGKGKSKSKAGQSSSSATESARRAAAIASVTAAASKRAPQAGNGPIMVAGKGREVVIASGGASTPAAESGAGGSGAAGEGKKKGRGRKKGGKNDGEGNEGPEGSKASTSTSTPAPAQKAVTKPPASQQQQSSKSTAATKRSDTPGGSVSGPKAERGPSNKGKGAGKDGSNAEGGASGSGGKGRNAGGRGGGGGKGGGEGGGGGRGGKEKSGRAQVIEILNRNTAPAPDGQGKARGGGRGGGAPARGQAQTNTGAGSNANANAGTGGSTGASRARIDVP